MNFIIETERLRLREFTFNDTAFIIALLNSPGWLQYIGDRNVKTEVQARQYLINGPMKSYIDYGYGLSLVEKKDSGEPIGMCGILNRDTLDTPDIGFAFLPDYNGNGYAYEIVSATLNYAQQQLGLTTIAAITVPDNTRSIRLLEKTGFTFVKAIQLPNSEEKLLLFNN